MVVSTCIVIGPSQCLLITPPLYFLKLFSPEPDTNSPDNSTSAGISHDWLRDSYVIRDDKGYWRPKTGYLVEIISRRVTERFLFEG